MNKQSRRHPTHPSLPILYSSKKNVSDVKEKKAKVVTPKKSYKPQKDKV